MKYFTPFIGNLFLLFALPALADQGERILAMDTSTCTVGVDCCTGTSACQNVGSSGTAVIKTGSCVGQAACKYAAELGGSAEIGEQSCIGKQVCVDLGNQGTATVGNDSCVGERACFRSAKFTGEIQIGNGSCKAQKSCNGLAQYAAEGYSNEVGRIVIGDNACNCERCCNCLRPGDVAPDGMCNELGSGAENCCVEAGDRNPFGPLMASNLCPEEQDKCLKAEVKGDPHITTFSGLNYDCMGQGEFILSKSQRESDPLEIRALLVDPQFAGEANPWENGDSPQTVTRGVAFIVDEDVPMIRVTTDPEGDAATCNLYFYVEGVGDVSYEDMLGSSTVFDRTQVEVSELTIDDITYMRFLFGDYDADIHVSVKPSRFEGWGCVMQLSACLKPIYHGDVLGLFGTNNPYRDDDWTTPDGTLLPIPMRPKEGSAQGLSSHFCIDNWCYKGPEGNGDPTEGSFFSDADVNYYSRCDAYPYTNLYNATELDEMLDAMRDSCEEQDIFNIASDVLYDAAVQYHVRFPNRNDCPVELIADVEEFNLIQILNCSVAPTPTPAPVPPPSPGTRPPTRIEITTDPPTPPPPTPGTGGDPHFRTWQDEHFEYHGQCDLTLVKDGNFADGLGLDIQIRTKVVRYWSYIKNAAIRIGNDILEFEGTADVHDPNAHYWINFEERGDLDEFAGFPVTQEANAFYKRKFTIDLSSKYPGTSITIQILKEFLRIKFNGDQSAFENSVGLLGNYTTGKTLARDGVTEIDDWYELGDEWQVLPSEPKLFHETSHPQFPEHCIKPDDPRGERRRRLAESGISLEEAEAACSSALSDPIEVKDCVYDILATQDMDMVGAF